MRKKTHRTLCAIAFLVGPLIAASAQAQSTNIWILNGNGYWTTTNNWLPVTNYPNSAGAVALITNNISTDRAVILDANINLGQLILGDWDRANLFRLTNTTATAITFDTGDSSMALFEHGKSTESG